MFLQVMFLLALVSCVLGVIWFGYRTVRVRGANPVTVSATAPPAAAMLGLILLGALSALGFKWAKDRRQQKLVTRQPAVTVRQVSDEEGDE